MNLIIKKIIMIIIIINKEWYHHNGGASFVINSVSNTFFEYIQRSMAHLKHKTIRWYSIAIRID